MSGQRSANENEGGLLRQGFPRGIGLHKITERMVLDAAEQLNKRPRKCLHYQTPVEVCNELFIAGRSAYGPAGRDLIIHCNIRRITNFPPT